MIVDRAVRILVADDEPLFLRTTVSLLEKAGFECRGAPHGHAALEMLQREKFDLILSDLDMPGNSQLEVLHRSRETWPDIPLVVITGAPSLPSAIESLRLGIADYLLKPVKYDDLLQVVRKALTNSAANQTPVPKNTPADSARSKSIGLIGECPPMLAVREMIERSAASDANVLITGPSGTGKELVAESIHRQSRRSGRPFQVVDCTAIPESLFESVLFGHARGAFTGAVRDQPGLLLNADGGTVFLDEIGELPAVQQAKLLRVIQTQSFTPVGMAQQRQVDVRFLCATNVDLDAEVDAGRFRGDLFYRLAVIHIEMPSLKARGDDVVRLAEHFLVTLRPECSPVRGFSPEVIALFREYNWPGNVRELRNAVERGHALCKGTAIVPEDLPPAIRERTPPSATSNESRAEALLEAEKHYLIGLLKEQKGNIAGCSRAAKVSRQCLHGLLVKHQLDPAEFR
ncbi:Transcriptional regulatory protein ZraR [Caulifigura coniformis]|uniref:Transcriptional regulatory protein ZraR n=1 Tax=Caulifigura coniformis TaxID=2527983 RepID=A0A517SDP9_9PLAN|nr:sigma-54 dependent transcriptional regulator [Caulifigura coniformis]QDT54253.1 Transcriptional regulatory protein ZraR [Caulifigura coniformis]